VRFPLFPLILLIATTACATPAAPGSGAQQSAGQPRASRSLTMIFRFEPNDLAQKIPGGGLPILTKRIFNAAPALYDGQGNPQPYLLATFPQLNSDSWRVFPDGRMETRYSLRPGLTWQDGSPLTAGDFVFAHRFYTAPGLGVFIATPQDRIDEVVAQDATTFVVRWHSPYPDAGVIKEGDLDPLPRHLLEPALAAYEADAGTREQLLNAPFWSAEYIGAGPYKLERWEPGSRIEGSAFAGHALGRPRIDRLIMRIVADENTVLNTVLAGEADFTADFTLRFEHARVLQREWEPSGKGKVMLKSSGPVSNTIQLRPELAAHPGQLDARVRKALAHGIDRESLNHGLFEGVGYVTENPVPDGVPYFAEIERAMDRHSYDPRMVESLMSEAGYSKDREGIFANAAGERFRTEFRVNAGPEFERSQAIMVDTWRRAGLEVGSSILPANMLRNVEALHTFPGMATRGGGMQERTWISSEVATAATRWIGENRAGWSDATYDALFERFSRSLDQAERRALVVQMVQRQSQGLPTLILYQAIQVNTHVAALRGPGPEVAGWGVATPRSLPHWNMHEWDWAS
jgi:peptide/nickel transport system substrate-binding protein